MTAREELRDFLTPLLPAGWRLVPYADSLDTPDAPTVMLHATTVTRAPAAPLGSFLTTFVASVIEPAIDPQQAEGLLDDELAEFLAALDSASTIVWTSAERVVFGLSELPAWDITLQVITTKD